VGSRKRDKNKICKVISEKIFYKKEMTLQNIQTTKQEKEGSKSTELERKIDSITVSLSKPYFNKILKDLSNRNWENVKTVCDYILAEQTEINIKESTKEGKIKILVWLSNHFEDQKSFKDMTKHDIVVFLNKLRKSHLEDPTHKWIGSYNGRQMILNKFFRWLYNVDEPDPRKRETPECMKGVRKLPRKEKTSYNSEDIWGQQEHAIFLKYCPSIRDRCYHAISVDTSCRPHELLNLKIKDIKFDETEDGKHYAEVRVVEGKTGTRKVPLIDSLPYVKEYLSSKSEKEYPTIVTNTDSWVFVSTGNNHGSKLTYDGLATRYEYYRKKYFPFLLNDETIPESDKSWIRNMLTKPWNLYILRHYSLTEKSQILPEAVLRDHAGWSMSSKMPQVYIHLSNESSKILLQKRGILKSEDRDMSSLQTRGCPNCQEPNKSENKFCMKCKMVLEYDSYTKTLEEKEEQENRINQLEIQIQQIKQGQQELLELLKHPEQLSKIASMN
jgi:integrase